MGLEHITPEQAVVGLAEAAKQFTERGFPKSAELIVECTRTIYDELEIMRQNFETSAQQHEALGKERDEWKLRYEDLFNATEQEIYVRERREREAHQQTLEQLEACREKQTMWANTAADRAVEISELKAAILGEALGALDD